MMQNIIPSMMPMAIPRENQDHDLLVIGHPYPFYNHKELAGPIDPAGLPRLRLAKTFLFQGKIPLREGRVLSPPLFP